MLAAVNGLISELDQSDQVSPSASLDAPDPSASIVHIDEEYNALADQLEAPAAASERLRQSLGSRPLRQ